MAVLYCTYNAWKEVLVFARQTMCSSISILVGDDDGSHGEVQEQRSHPSHCCKIQIQKPRKVQFVSV